MLKFASSKQPQGHSKRAEFDVDLHSFTKALVANLVDLKVRAVRPHDMNDRRGFAAVVRALDTKVKILRKEGAASRDILAVAQIANELRGSSTGNYEGFEAALRSLQLTFTASPNPFYDDISFPVSQVQARSFTESISKFQRELAASAAKAFVRAREQG
ncbi:hypothetical protein [Bradyrhizobium iriomotense]|uniref:hypothetical protein n=1 Tax=Bradyrhizobium iriomotense TaxID=441950 RepID=UPI001B8A51DD|nr:hypothetical protein [Bradyrhizobium iriomotense]MBR1129495.1 hypothetical protein [Bradyrhizobium iriomotense]